MKMIKIAAVILSFVFMCACIFIFKSQKGTPNIGYTTFKSNRGWGYNIIVNDTIVIHQHIMPAVPTSHGFTTEKQAALAAEIIVTKLINKQLPAITTTELSNILAAGSTH